MMTLSMNQASMFQSVEKRCTVITLSYSKQPSGCSFFKADTVDAHDCENPALRCGCPQVLFLIVLDLFFVHAMFSS